MTFLPADDPRLHVLEAIRGAEAAADAGQIDRALVGYQVAIESLTTGPVSSRALVIDLQLRRAALFEGRRDHAGADAACAAAFDVAVAEPAEELTAFKVVYVTLKMLNRREVWAELERTARALFAFARDRRWDMVAFEAMCQLPYAYRGLGLFEEARDQALAILDTLREHHDPDGKAEWARFLDSLDDD